MSYKKLKDYIGKYIPCRIVIKGRAPYTYELMGFDLRDGQIYHPDYPINPLLIDQIILLLKPIKLLSDEEHIALWNTAASLGGKRERSPAKEAETMARYIDMIRHRGYDVDGLIEAGLAFDETLLKSHTP